MWLTILKGWLIKGWGYLVAIAAVLAGLFAIRQSGVSAGKQEIQQEMNKAAAKAREKVRDVDIEVDSMDDAAIRDRAQRWVRDNKR